MDGDNSAQYHTDLVTRVCDFLQDALPDTVSLHELGNHFHLSPYHLQRKFKQVTGISPHQYAARLKMEDFKAQVRQGSRITDAMISAGYGSSSRLYERSDEELGMTPTTYRQGGTRHHHIL